MHQIFKYLYPVFQRKAFLSKCFLLSIWFFYLIGTLFAFTRGSLQQSAGEKSNSCASVSNYTTYSGKNIYSGDINKICSFELEFAEELDDLDSDYESNQNFTQNSNPFFSNSYSSILYNNEIKGRSISLYVLYHCWKSFLS
jgi:hypothetical protein